GDRQLNWGPVHGRRDQAAMRPEHQDLHRPASRRRQDRMRSHPMRQALPRPPRLATPRTPTDPHLTDIEASPTPTPEESSNEPSLRPPLPPSRPPGSVDEHFAYPTY